MPSLHCLCGRTRAAFDAGRVLWRKYCHCESCRRATGAPVAAFLALPDTAWRWRGVRPATYRSSPGVTRSFCAACGTPMAYATDDRPDETHFYAATLADPTDFAPEGHDFWNERLPWLGLQDDLPKQGG